MDIKFLLLGLLFITVDVFPAYAGPVAGVEEAIGKEEKEIDIQSEVKENKEAVTKSIAKTYLTKAKVLQSTAKIYSQVTRDRETYFNEYTKLAEDTKAKAKENEQKALAVVASVEGSENRRRDWDVKSREAHSQGKSQKVAVRRIISSIQELFGKMETASIAAGVLYARAIGQENLSNEEREASHELKLKAEEFLNDAAKNHYTKSKEAEQKVMAEKLKVKQNTEEAEKHLQTAKALQEQSLKAEVASDGNLAAYITLTMQADEAWKMSKEKEMCASVAEMMSGEMTRRAQIVEAIATIMGKECKFYEERAKKEEGEAMVLSESAKEVESDYVSNSASILKMASIKDSGIENEDTELTAFPVKTISLVDQKLMD